MEQYQTSWSRKNSVRQRAERFSRSKNLAETGGSEKCISPWFHCPLSGGRRPTLYFTVFRAVGRPTPSSEGSLKGPHLISPFTQWAACSPHLLLSDSYNAYTKVKVVSPCEVWSITSVDARYTAEENTKFDSEMSVRMQRRAKSTTVEKTTVL